ncbi:hypothetical protein QBC39DRAFT_373596 [Podospora conica]|nr:hypothetical protein QBC39DRAFT_373596 [Schizothecium conicum]
MSQDPNRSLSHKLRQLGRLNLKPKNNGAQDKGHSPLQNAADFQIVHTPDRPVSSKPTPSVEECREEIKRWHREAAETGRVVDSDEDDVEFSLTPTVSRETATRESRRLAGEWAITSSSRGASPSAGDDERRDGEVARGLGGLSLGDGGTHSDAAGRNKTKGVSYGDFPIFQPPPRHQQQQPPQKANPPSGFLSPASTQKAYTTPRRTLDGRKSPLANQYTLDSSGSDSSSDLDTPTPTTLPPLSPLATPLPHPLNEILYARGLCPSCLHPRSKIEGLRCGRCQAHLSVYSKTKPTATTASDPVPVPVAKPTPSPARRPMTPLLRARSPVRSPPPLRERVFLSQSRSASASVSRERHRQAASPTPKRPPKRRSASLRDLGVSPAREWTYLPLVKSERRPGVVGRGTRGRGRGQARSRSRSRSRGRGGVGLGLGLSVGEKKGGEGEGYDREGEDAELLAEIYEDYGGGSRFTFGGFV